VPSPSTALASQPAASPAEASPSALPLDPKLEPYLPATFLGHPLQRFSGPGSTFTEGGDMCLILCPGEPYRFAARLRVPVEDVTVGVALTDGLAPVVAAYRVDGVAARTLIQARHAIGGYSLNSTTAKIPLTSFAVAGRTVKYLPRNLFNETGEYLIAFDGVLVVLFGEPPGNDGSVPTYIQDEVAALP